MSAVDEKEGIAVGESVDYGELMEEGQQLVEKLDYSAALKVFDRALKASQKMTGDEKALLVARARNGYAECCEVVGRWDRAQRELRRTVESELEGEERFEVARALLELGTVLSRRGERDEARDHYQEAMEVADEIGAVRLKTIAQCHLGANSGRTGEMDSSYRHLEDATRAVNELPDDPENAEVKALLESQYGLYYFRTGQNKKAEEHFQAALKALDGKPSLEEASVRRFLGVMAGLRREHREALNNHLVALKIYKEAGCRYGQAKVYDSIGRTFLAVNRMEEAI
ncbi:MAG: tetratricopeptide repeat protein, partial [Candidatus Eremiobacteraeota bacterium]|nr:tetratricopeptide repeat protein [Candidatus Eremiobacteraeota bacterium]